MRGHGTSHFRHSDKQRRFSRSHNRRSTGPRQDCIAPCSSWHRTAHSKSSDRIGPEVLLDREALLALLVLLALEVPVVRDRLADQIGLARKP